MWVNFQGNIITTNITLSSQISLDQSQNVRQRNADLNRVREGNSHVLPVDTDNGVEIIDATDKLLDSSVNANNKLKYVVSTVRSLCQKIHFAV